MDERINLNIFTVLSCAGFCTTVSARNGTIDIALMIAMAKEEAMKMTIDMPYVEDCMITDCAYNRKSKCHARAITIGDGVMPGCDTAFLGASKHTHNTKLIAGVGACKIVGCNYNDDLECTAEKISIDMKKGEISCMTFVSRE